ncbi:DUF4038 domain-containing protein [Kiritimatiellaeota bacterium B1221]|nr:DUF4038 domain-containing protein [Kiritimatiellaeota bacterium B1221]
MTAFSPQKGLQGQVLEWRLTGAKTYSNPYTDLSVWLRFRHESGREMKRPAFWDGGSTWRIRFAIPEASGTITWESFSDVADDGLNGNQGTIECTGPGNVPLLSMSKGKRNIVDGNGRGKLLIADTAWALPWRATDEMCKIYAADRKQKGFNAALLMTVQPDMKAEGPQDRASDGGFDRGFKDLHQGTLRQLRPAYFKTFDRLVRILLEAGITPIYQPLFHGYGWKGLSVAGRMVDQEDYCRYCRYLLARYGAWPAVYLVGADGDGKEPGVRAGGREIEAWDSYQQPTGMHYNPMSSARQWQADQWLDFQWCQTGHKGEHRPERMADMWRNQPIKGVANGEPTYESMNHADNAAGWWQGQEAWLNFMAGGTMGVFYGAGSLWNWLYRPDEPGHQSWCKAPDAGWREALDFEGSRYPGVVGNIVSQYDFTDLAPQVEWTIGNRCVGKPHHFALVYLDKAEDFVILSQQVPAHYRIYCAKTGDVIEEGRRDITQNFCPISVPQCAGPLAVAFFP